MLAGPFPQANHGPLPTVIVVCRYNLPEQAFAVINEIRARPCRTATTVAHQNSTGGSPLRGVDL